MILDSLGNQVKKKQNNRIRSFDFEGKKQIHGGICSKAKKIPHQK